MMNRIFLIDSGSPEDSLMAWMLNERGYEVSLSSNVSLDDRETWQRCPPDVMLLNVMQPVAEAQHKILLYRQLLRVPVVAMLAPDLALSMRPGNVLSADHFILKPFQLEQLQALLQLVTLNRAARQGDEPEAGPWPLLERRREERRCHRCHSSDSEAHRERESVFKVDAELQDVFIDGTPLHLSRKEYALFMLLATNRGTLFADEQIMRRLWPNNAAVTETEVRQYIYRLRRKLESIPDADIRIETIRGRGYRLTQSVRPVMENLTGKVA